MRFLPFFIFSHLHHQQTDLPAPIHILLDFKNHEGRDRSLLFNQYISSALSTATDPL